MKGVFFINQLNLLNDFLSKYKVFIIIISVLLVLVAVLLFNQFKADENASAPSDLINETVLEDTSTHEKQTENASQKNIEIIVDIKGAVKNPNTYTMKSNDRVQQLVNKAQLRSDVDLTQVNLAERLTDQKMIIIPSKNDTTSPTAHHSSQSQNKTQPINLNTAEESDLTQIPGIGPAKAQTILMYREEHGQFQSIDELKEVKGIGDKTFENLKEYFVV
ncbi:helix-hairpin-helix domain-containing protein [Staphylococcus felis]